jgi:hypothetical protein
MTRRAELSSLATGLRDMVERVASIADDLAGEERDAIGPELMEVERSLMSAQRRLSRLIDS